MHYYSSKFLVLLNSYKLCKVSESNANPPDAVVGQFIKGKLVNGENVHISSGETQIKKSQLVNPCHHFSVSVINGIAVPQFSNPEHKTYLTRDISTGVNNNVCILETFCF